MAFCSNCGTELRTNDKFCPGCGAPVDGRDTSRRQQVFEGNIHKCPNCGEQIGSFTSKCPSCGFEFRDVNASSAIKEFAERLDKLQAQKKSPSVLGGVAAAFGFGKADNTNEQILDTIRNFSVPNTKEDVFEFMILASSNINTSVMSARTSSEAGANSEEEFNTMKARNDAWLAKMEQVYQKAKLSFGDDPDFARIEEIYSKTTSSIEDAERRKKNKAFKLFITIVAGILPFVLVFGGFGCFHVLKERELENTVREIQTDIANEDYDAALIKAQSLHMDDNWSDESKEHWDEQRESLIELINEKKAGK